MTTSAPAPPGAPRTAEASDPSNGSEASPRYLWQPSAGDRQREETLIAHPTNPRRSAALAAAALFVAASPLVVDPAGWFVYLPLRWLFTVLTVGAVAVALWRSGQPVRLPASRWWAALLLIAAGAAVASSAPLVAFVGANDRLAGLATWVLHAALAAIGASVVRRRRDLAVLARAMCVGLLGVAAVTLAQRSGWNFPSGASSFDRPGGPFGNANFLGAYCVLAVLVAAGVLLDRDQPARWRSVAASALPAGIGTVVLTGSRSSWLVLALGAAVMAFAWVRRGTDGDHGNGGGGNGGGGNGNNNASNNNASNNNTSNNNACGNDGNNNGEGVRSGRWRHRRALGAVAGVTAVAALCVVMGGAGGVGDRLGDLTGGTARGRVDTWVTALDVVARRPILGWGPEGFAEGVTGSIDAGWEQRYGRRLTPDRAHNGVLDIASTVGLLGLGAYIGVVWLTGVRVRRALVSDRRSDRRGGAYSTTALGIGVGLAAYLLHQQSLFPLFDVDGLAWLFAGGLAALAPEGPGTPGLMVRRRAASRAGVAGPARRWTLVAALATWTCLAVVGVSAVVADRHARTAADALARGEAAQAMDHAAASLDRSPGQVLPALLLADAAEAIGTDEALERGIAAVRTARRDGFDDGRLHLAEARLLLAAGDGQSLGLAARLLREQLAHDPARSEAWLLLGDVRAAGSTGEHDPSPSETAPVPPSVPPPAAVEAWEQARRLRPTWARPLERLAPAYAALGREEAALAAIRQLEALRGPDGPPPPVHLALLRAQLEAHGGP